MAKKSHCSVLSLSSQIKDKQILWYTQNEEHLAGDWEVDFPQTAESGSEGLYSCHSREEKLWKTI